MSRSTSRTEKPAPAVSDVKVTPEEAKIENFVPEPKSTAPVNIETETPSDEPTPAPEATPAEKIQTDVREKLSKKSVENDVFVPTNPAALEKAAIEVAKEQGFDLNRGTSVGARLLARAQKRV
jgi:hypothetical protein